MAAACREIWSPLPIIPCQCHACLALAFLSKLSPIALAEMNLSAELLAKIDELYFDFNIAHLVDLSVSDLAQDSSSSHEIPRQDFFSESRDTLPSSLPLLASDAVTQGDGKTCMGAIINNATMVGVCYSELHAEMLYKRLEHLVFDSMQTADSPLFEPALMSIIGGKKRRIQSKANPKKKSKAKKKKDEADQEEEEEEEDEAGDGEDDEDAEGSDEGDAESKEEEDDGIDSDEEDEGEEKTN